MSRWRAALPLILLVLAGLLLFASGSLHQLAPQRLVAHQAELHAQIASHPWLTRLAYIGLLTLTVATGIPGTIVVILAGGFAFGVVDATVFSSIGLTLGSLVLYLASRYAFGAGSRQPPAMVARLRHGFERHPASYTLFLRFVPVAPFGLVTISLAWLRCPLWLFLGASWLGGTVSLIFETSIGAGLGDAIATSHGGPLGIGLFLHREVLLPLGAIALLALLPLLLERLTRRRRQPSRHSD
ncbi:MULTISPECIES: TVP38/TMEM64 family protein [Rhodanobacter]|uniref:TVP38/TMEM64 family protein n=1 Tax=Rhodanobacter TaxID=75309 RepID=UPI000920BD80|nr:VTT domain-containing protein [Rhodanobacter thiooxydans]TAN16109.1 MAG: TVP38/TMEM64 family protein [Rhodanobacter sp.]UJJ55786.1 VTT domain-containing protein [Rhodanobacter thiooxydans]